MVASPPDLAQVRLDNALLLFDEFVRLAARHADAATLRGLERRFAERLQIQPSYWSQIKSRSRQIGERLARQFEHLMHKPRGWMDVAHPARAGGPGVGAVTGGMEREDESSPRDDDERFIVGLVLTYYRRHPARARTRLLDLLGEVLVPDETSVSSGASGTDPLVGPVPGRPARGTTPVDDEQALWLRSQLGVAPLKRK